MWLKFIDELLRASCMVFNVQDYPPGTRGLHALFSCGLKPNQQCPHAITSWKGTDPRPHISARNFVIAWKTELLNNRMQDPTQRHLTRKGTNCRIGRRT